MDADENTDYSISYHLGSCQKNMGILKKFINASGPPQAAAGQYTAARRLRRRTGPAGEVPGSGREGPLAGGLAASDGWCNAPPIFSFSAAQKKRKRAVHGPKEKKMRGAARLGQRTGRISARGRESTGGGRLRKGLSSWPRLRAAAAETYLRFAFQESRCLLKTAKRSVC